MEFLKVLWWNQFCSFHFYMKGFNINYEYFQQILMLYNIAVEGPSKYQCQ